MEWLAGTADCAPWASAGAGPPATAGWGAAGAGARDSADWLYVDLSGASRPTDFSLEAAAAALAALARASLRAPPRPEPLGALRLAPASPAVTSSPKAMPQQLLHDAAVAAATHDAPAAGVADRCRRAPAAAQDGAMRKRNSGPTPSPGRPRRQYRGCCDVTHRGNGCDVAVPASAAQLAASVCGCGTI
jgi:hypothetical protein